MSREPKDDQIAVSTRLSDGDRLVVVYRDGGLWVENHTRHDMTAAPVSLSPAPAPIPIHRVTPPRLRGEPEPASSTCATHGDPLVCLACEAEEDARPEWVRVSPQEPPVDVARVVRQSQEVSALLSAAGCGAMPITEGVRWLVEQHLQRSSPAQAQIETLRAALQAIETLLSEEITARFGGHPSKSEETMGRKSSVYALLSLPRNMARAALFSLTEGTR